MDPIWVGIVLALAAAVLFTAIFYYLLVKREPDVASSVATIFGALLAVITLVAGLIIYQSTAQLQNRAEATSTVQSYLAVRADYPDPTPRFQNGERKGELNDRYGWIASQAYAAAETIYLANPTDPGWLLTARELVSEGNMSDYAKDDAWEGAWFRCGYYSADFIEDVVEHRLGDDVCPEPPPPVWWRRIFGG